MMRISAPGCSNSTRSPNWNGAAFRGRRHAIKTHRTGVLDSVTGRARIFVTGDEARSISKSSTWEEGPCGPHEQSFASNDPGGWPVGGV